MLETETKIFGLFGPKPTLCPTCVEQSLLKQLLKCPNTCMVNLISRDALDNTPDPFLGSTRDNKVERIRASESGGIVLVCESCHNKIPHTGWLNRNQFFQSSESLKSKDKVSRDLVSSEAFFLGLQMAISSHDLSSVCMHSWCPLLFVQIFFSYKDISYIALGLTLTASY